MRHPTVSGHIEAKSEADVVYVVSRLIGAFMQTSGTFPELNKPGRKPKKGGKK